MPKFLPGSTYTGNREVSLTPKTTYLKIKTNRMFTVELEYNVFGRLLQPNLFYPVSAQIVRDGSVRVSEEEIVLGPMSGDLGLKTLKKISTNSYTSQVDETCGYHVHIDARDASMYDIRNLILLWAHHEKLFFNVFPERQNHPHCLPLNGIPRYVRFIKEILPSECLLTPDFNRWFRRLLRVAIFDYNPNNVELQDNKTRKHTPLYNLARRNALNLYSFLQRGTIECRIAPGSLQDYVLVGWPISILYFYEWAINKTEQELQSILKAPPSLGWLSKKLGLINPTYKNIYERFGWID